MIYVYTQRHTCVCMVMHFLPLGICSEKCFLGYLHGWANVIECSYTNLDGVAKSRLHGMAFCSLATNLYNMLLH